MCGNGVRGDIAAQLCKEAGRNYNPSCLFVCVRPSRVVSYGKVISMEQIWTQVDIYTTTEGLEILGSALSDIGHPSFAVENTALGIT
jgi:hypothetical protein